jgi:hypothetical protein
MTRTALSGVIITVLVVSSAHAQQIEAPPRASGVTRGERPVDPQRNRQEVTAQTNILVGYDDNLISSATTTPFSPRDSGYTGAGTGMLRFFSGRDRHSIDISGRGLVNSYETLGSSYGGRVDVLGETMVGRTEVSGFQSVRSMPFFALGVFGPLTQELGAESPDTNPSNGLTADRSLATDSVGSVRRQWTRSFVSDGSYTFSRQTYSGGTAFDSRTHAGSIGAERNLGRNTAIRTSYRYSDSEHIEVTGQRLPQTDHNVDVGLEHRRRVSRSRQVSLSVGAGALHVDTLNTSTRAPLSYWTPSGRGSLQYDFGRTWSVAGNYRRGLSVLNGLQPASYISDTVSIRTGGFIGERVESAWIVGYGNGHASDDPDTDYYGYTGTAQLRIHLGRGWSWLANINHYRYRLSEEASVLLGVPGHVHRNAIWTGVTWSAPLFRRYMRGTTR